MVTRLYQVLNYIKAHPEEWEQSVWHHCFAGHACCIGSGTEWTELYMFPAQLDQRRVPKDLRHKVVSTFNYAMHWLGLTEEQATEVFKGNNTLEDLERIIDGYVHKSK